MKKDGPPQIGFVCQPFAAEKCGLLWQKEYCEFHKKALKNPKNSKYLSFNCHSSGHGGLGNRIQGIVSVFFLALLTDRVFLINWIGPGKIADYLEPNQINWDLPLSRFGTFHKSFWGVIPEPGGYDHSVVKSEDAFSKWSLETDFESDVLQTRFEAVGTIFHFLQELYKNPYLRTQAAMKELPSSPSQMFGCGFQFLFRKSLAMVRALRQARLSLGRKPPLLGIHVRTSDHHWGSTNPFSYRSHNSTLFFMCAREQSNFIRQRFGSSFNDLKWFLAADDKAVKTAAKKQFPDEIISLNLNPKHLAFGWQDSNTIRDVLLDIFLLAESDFLLLTFGSSFSRLVTAVGLHDENSVADGERCLVNQTALMTVMSRLHLSLKN